MPLWADGGGLARTQARAEEGRATKAKKDRERSSSFGMRRKINRKSGSRSAYRRQATTLQKGAEP